MLERMTESLFLEWSDILNDINWQFIFRKRWGLLIFAQQEQILKVTFNYSLVTF